MTGKVEHVRVRWGIGPALHSQDIIAVRPDDLEAFLEGFPQYAGWNRVEWAWLDVVLLVESALSSGVLMPRPIERDEEWERLLDERVVITSAKGRG